MDVTSRQDLQQLPEQIKLQLLTSAAGVPKAPATVPSKELQSASGHSEKCLQATKERFRCVLQGFPIQEREVDRQAKNIGELTTTRAEAEPPRTEAGLPPRLQVPAGSHKVSHRAVYSKRSLPSILFFILTTHSQLPSRLSRLPHKCGVQGWTWCPTHLQWERSSKVILFWGG